MTARSLGQYYRTDGDTLERVYKEHLSGYYSWKDRPHADKYLLFPENFGPKMSIDETSTKDGELFTILSNKEGHCKKGSIAAIIRGTRAEDVVDALQKVPELVRKQVGEVTLDFSSSMAAIVETVFPWAYHTLDRFHMQSMAIDAIRNLRMKHKREAMAEEAICFRAFLALLVSVSVRLISADRLATTCCLYFFFARAFLSISVCRFRTAAPPFFIPSVVCFHAGACLVSRHYAILFPGIQAGIRRCQRKIRETYQKRRDKTQNRKKLAAFEAGQREMLLIYVQKGTAMPWRRLSPFVADFIDVRHPRAPVSRITMGFPSLFIRIKVSATPFLLGHVQYQSHRS